MLHASHHTQWHSQVLWHPGLITAMAAPDGNCELQKRHNDFLNLLLFGSII
jgi:hypothetical protein